MDSEEGRGFNRIKKLRRAVDTYLNGPAMECCTFYASGKLAQIVCIKQIHQHRESSNNFYDVCLCFNIGPYFLSMAPPPLSTCRWPC